MTQNTNTYPRTAEDLGTEARFDARVAREEQPGLGGEVAAQQILAAAASSPEANTLPTVAETKAPKRTADDLAAEARVAAGEAKAAQPGVAGDIAALAIIGAATNGAEAQALPTAAEAQAQMPAASGDWVDKQAA